MALNPFSTGLSSVCSAVAAVFNWITGRSNANNAQDVKDAKKGADEAAAVDKTNAAIEKRDVKEIQNEFAE